MFFCFCGKERVVSDDGSLCFCNTKQEFQKMQQQQPEESFTMAKIVEVATDYGIDTASCCEHCAAELVCSMARKCNFQVTGCTLPIDPDLALAVQIRLAERVSRVSYEYLELRHR